MYAGASRAGLGMYGHARRLGLGDATVDVTDINAVAAAAGIQIANAGYPDFASFLADLAAKGQLVQTVQGTPVFRGGATAQAFANVWQVLTHRNANGYLLTGDQVVQLLVPGSTLLTPGPQPANLPVSPTDWRQYTNNVVTFAPLVAAMFAAANPSAVQPLALPNNAPVTVDTQWRDALAAGALTDPTSGQQIPTSLILEGPVTLPDGNVYVRYHDIVGESFGQNPTPVLWWKGPTWRPATSNPANGQVKINGDLFDIPDPGTGDWYLQCVIAGPQSVVQPPAGWTGTCTLPADILASLQLQDGSTPISQNYTPAPTTTPATVPAPATQPVLYQSPNAPPPSPGTAPAAAPVPVTPMYTPIVTVPPATIAQPAAPSTSVLYQSPMSSAPDGVTAPVLIAAAPATDNSGWLLAAALGLGGYAWYKSRKTSRRGASWR